MSVDEIVSKMMGIIVGEFETFSPKDGVTIRLVKEYNMTAYQFRVETQDETIEKKLVMHNNDKTPLWEFEHFAKEIQEKINE